MIEYSIFETEWGWCGFAVCDNLLIRNVLPGRNRDVVADRLIGDVESAKEIKGEEWAKLKKTLIAYYGGSYVDFSGVKLDLAGKTSFAKDVLNACRKIPFGETVSYSELAKMSGHPGSARAVGTVMSGNRHSIIVPCHRVIKADGKLGGFTNNKPGATKLKARLLAHEHKIRDINS